MTKGKGELVGVNGGFDLSGVKLQHTNEADQGKWILLFKASKKASTIKAT